MPHWRGFLSQVCSKTPHLYPHWQDLPELRVGAQQIDTDARCVAVQSPREIDYTAAHHRPKSKREGAPWDPFGPESVRAQVLLLRSASQVTWGPVGMEMGWTRSEDVYKRPDRADLSGGPGVSRDTR